MFGKNRLTIMTFIVIACAAVILLSTYEANRTDLSYFESDSALSDFLSQNSQRQYGFSGGQATTESTKGDGSESFDSSSGNTAPSTSYSGTNVQVQGVDEPDIIKTDGKYIYALSGNNLSIIDAYPAENAQIRSIIPVEGYASEFLIADDKLILFSQAPMIYYAAEKVAGILPGPQNQQSTIIIYDISNKENPEKIKEISYDGSYYDARLIGSYAYILVNQQIYDARELPVITEDGDESKIAAQDIAYFPVPDSSYQLTTIFIVNLEDLDVSRASFLTGYTSTLYVSENSIYLSSQKYVPYEDYQLSLIEKTILPNVDGETRDKMREVLDSSDSTYDKSESITRLFEDYYNSLDQETKDQLSEDLLESRQEIEADLQKETQKTIIHKLSFEENSLYYVGKAEVPGILLNQFSLDEHDDYLRVATTTGDTWTGTSLNHIYVLDSNMKLVGSLEDLANGERIYSARFLGDRAYLVTFKQIDPLFVIDLSDPTDPEVLGELKIPGYSEYLHPYDENHVIGIGRDVQGEIAEGQSPEGTSIMAAIPAGLKLALFDVSDPANPKEVDTFIVGGKGSDSDALYEHKAFLFDKEKNLLVLPVTVRETTSDMWQWGRLMFEGAYVFDLSENGFELKGKITHLTPSEISSIETSKDDYAYAPWEAHIQRSLYIEDTLYTMSQRSILATDLETLQDIKKIDLPISFPDYTTYGYAEDVPPATR